VDELFRSALPFASKVTAALLTGMGRDGAQGMLELRKAGAATIAQDEATSVVYGMPRAAWEIGAAQIRLPLDQIGPDLLARCAGHPSEVAGR
jgi:two-component system chemotaxis response regulator CheB